MTIDPSNPGAVRELLLSLRGMPEVFPPDLDVEGPVHARTAAAPGALPLPGAHPRTFIYKGRASTIEHPFAIKVYDMASSNNTTAWIESEANVLARLQALAGAGQGLPLAGSLLAADAKKGVLVSEWIEGRDLRKWLTLYGRLPGKRLRGVIAAGQWLAAYNQAMNTLPGTASVSGEVSLAHEAFSAAGVMVPEVEALLKRIDRAAEHLDGAACLIAARHGDFSPNNLLMTSKGLPLRAIDFSLPVQVPVAQDAAQFLINRSIRLSGDISKTGKCTDPWQTSEAFRAFVAGYGKAAQTALPPRLMSFYALVWCVRRMTGLALSSRQINRAWYDRLDRRLELKRHTRLASIFARHLET